MRRAVLLVVLLSLCAAPAARAWTWPASGPVLRPFAFDPAHPFAGGQHRGMDVGGAPGEGVVAPASGLVTFAGSAAKIAGLEGTGTLVVADPAVDGQVGAADPLGGVDNGKIVLSSEQV